MVHPNHTVEGKGPCCRVVRHAFLNHIHCAEKVKCDVRKKSAYMFQSPRYCRPLFKIQESLLYSTVYCVVCKVYCTVYTVYTENLTGYAIA